MSEEKEVPIEAVVLDLLQDLKRIKDRINENPESNNIKAFLKARAGRLFNQVSVLADTIQSLRDRDIELDELEVEISKLE